MTTAQRLFYTDDTVNADSYFRYTRIAHAARDRGLALDAERQRTAASIWFSITTAACRLAARGEWVRV